MRYFIFGSPTSMRLLGTSRQALHEVLHRVAADTPTEDLVIALYLRKGTKTWQGQADCQYWLSPKDFLPKKGSWRFARRHGIPADLPGQFKLIRLAFGTGLAPYPRTQDDSYGFSYHYPTFHDDLAELFAHELHHFQTAHLGWHGARRGEISANLWALDHVQKLGFHAKGKRLKKTAARKAKPAPAQNPEVLSHIFYHLDLLGPEDLEQVGQRLEKLRKDKQKQRPRSPAERHCEQLRSLPRGTPVTMVYAHDAVIQPGETVYIDEILRKGARRIGIKTRSGEAWRVPMEWLETSDLHSDLSED